ncbi:MAG: T9SS type A sorting domain-containing protein, partial [Chlamydiia bacterium]|nr:T9SS type A sorting domain-containing protein [Chlamydiia bacterium]
PIPNDAGVELLVGLNNTVSTTVLPLVTRVRNFGSDPITTVDVDYTLNGVAGTTVTYNATTIQSRDSVDVSMGNITLNDGMNHITAYTTLTGDTNFFNDTLYFDVFREAVVNLAYCDDFEGSDLWMPDTLMNQWERGIPTMININSAHSPTNVWAIDLDSTYNNGMSQYLYTPKFVITSSIDSATLDFYHYYETQSAADGGFIQYRINEGYWASLGYIGDTRGTNWYTDNVGGTYMWTDNSNGWVNASYEFDFTAGEFNMPNAGNDTMQFRFVFFANASSNNYDGWAIDDVCFSLPIAPQDAGATAINTPVTSVQVGETVTVSIDVKNYGSNVQTSIPVWYQVNNDGIVTETYNVSGSGLAMGGTGTYTFTIPFVAPGADFQLCVGTDLSNDAYPQNDEICTSLAVTPANIDGGVTSVGVLQSYVISGDTTIITDGDFTNPITVIAEIKNFGMTTLTSFDVKYSKNGGTDWITETWTGSLATNEVDTFEFATTYNSPIGNYSLCVRTMIPNDALATNDELCAPFVGMVTIEDAIANAFAVSQNEPNPAYGNVRIDYIVPTDGEIVFELRNSLGQMVYSAEKASFVGDNTIEIDAKDLASGVYYYTITFDTQRITRKMIVNQ